MTIATYQGFPCRGMQIRRSRGWKADTSFVILFAQDFPEDFSFQTPDPGGSLYVRPQLDPQTTRPAEVAARQLAFAGTVVMQEDIGSLAETEELLDHTIHVHVRNAAPGKMQTSMEDGAVDFAWLIEALNSRSYAGAVAIEYLDAAEAEAVKLRDELVRLGLTL